MQWMIPEGWPTVDLYKARWHINKGFVRFDKIDQVPFNGDSE